MQINSWEKNILHWKKYRSWRTMLKKNLTPYYVGEKNFNSREVWEKIRPIHTKSVKSPIPHSPTNVQWSCQPFRGWGNKRIWHLGKCHPSTKWLARVHGVWWLSWLKFCTVKSPIPHSPTNVQWSCQLFRGWGNKRIWHLGKCRPSTKWLARVHGVVAFMTKVLHFKIENTPIKDTNGKRKFKRMLSFLFVDKRKLFAMKLSFEE